MKFKAIESFKKPTSVSYYGNIIQVALRCLSSCKIESNNPLRT